MSTGEIEIGDLRINHDARCTIWRTFGVDIMNPETQRPTGVDETALTVVLDIDGEFDAVYGDLRGSGDIPTLERAIATLTRVRDALQATVGHRGRPGRCFAVGDWGRCYEDHGHRSPHRFPAAPKNYPLSDDERAEATTKVLESSVVQ